MLTVDNFSGLWMNPGRQVAVMTLDQLQIGEHARIIAVGGAGALRRRLMDMGLTPGTVVLIRKTAPMGDPIEIYLRGYELTLRKEDADKIQVEPLPRGSMNDLSSLPAPAARGRKRQRRFRGGSS